jgi:hypothetical protein
MTSITNKEFMKMDAAFINACDNVHIKPTKRQASKWRNNKGLAFKNGKRKLDV